MKSTDAESKCGGKVQAMSWNKKTLLQITFSKQKASEKLLNDVIVCHAPRNKPDLLQKAIKHEIKLN